MPVKKKPFSKFIIFVIILVSIITGTLGAGLIWVFTLDIPDFQSFDDRKIIQSTKIYDRTGEILLYDIHSNIKRTVIPFEQIPRHVKNATIAIEDTEFYSHKGISLSSIVRALLANLKSRGISQGGSTITQQLIKNTFLTPEQTIARKIKEAVLALKVEKILSKEQILELYLNEIPYGSSNYGIEAASESFFGKKANELTLGETAYLATLPKAPTYYSPYGSHVIELENRKDLVLKRMLNLDFITEEEYQKARNEKIQFLGSGDKGLKAPHFVMFIKNYLVEQFGEGAVEQDGLKVITTLDYELQEKAEALTKEYAEQNQEKFNAYNAGLVGIDPKTGQILVMVGSRDWSDQPLPEGCQPGIDCRFEPKPNVTTYGQGRQPGSAFKPFVYATAFKKGYTPETVVFDLKTEFSSSCNPDSTPKPGIEEDECYQPKNYDKIFRGPVTFREALAQSINVPSVKVLYLAGIRDSIRTAEDMGITTLAGADRYGLTLVLGGGEVRLLEMTSAYSGFANDGIKNPATGILRIENSRGKILEEFSPQPQRAVEQNIARLINDILSDNQARAPAFGEHSWLYFPDREVAVKTGTTNDYRDAWVIGYSPNFALGAWVGNNDNSSMEKKVAGFIVAPLWNAFFKEVFKELAQENFSKPDLPAEKLKPFLRGEWQGNNTYLIDKVSGKRATEHTPQDLIEEKIITQIHSLLYWLNKDDPKGPSPANHQDSQFALWEKPVRDWAENQQIKEEEQEDLPQEFDDVHKPEYQPIIQILSPEKDSVFRIGETIKIRLASESHFSLKQVDFFLNNDYIGSAGSPPFDFSFVLDNPSLLKKDPATLKLVAYDQVENSASLIVPLKINP